MPTKSITQTPFGTLPSGLTATLFTLTNENGMIARITDFGATLTELHIPLPDGSTRDVVLGFSDLKSYENGHPYFGSTVGRVAGRLTGASYSHQGEKISLTQNDGANHLHGGLNTIDKFTWETSVENDTLTLKCLSPAGHEGYPGNVEITVSYRLTSENAIEITYSATTDATTPLSLTNHSYFNLDSPAAGLATDHTLQILANQYVPSLQDGTLSDKKLPVVPDKNDFRQPIRLSSVLAKIDRQHGDNYLLNGEKTTNPRQVATVTASDESITMEVLTTEPCMQFYTALSMDPGVAGKNNTPYPPHSALCFECHGYPNSPNAPDFQSTLLHPGETYHQQTIYKFK
ncbi:MAG: aldose epimerase family protein [Luteolibacter sp.]